MELYKPRGFAEYFQDTFAFLKQNGRHFFKHYFIINGAFIIILLACFYFFMRFYTDFITSNLNNPDAAASMENYMNENGGLMILIGIAVFFLALIAGVLNYVYTPVYLILYEKHQGSSFGTKDILNYLKEKAGKILIFILAGIIVSIPVLIAAGIISFVLMITIVGMLLIIMVMALIMMIYQFALIEYLQEEKGVFDSFSYALQLCFKKFWAATGCVSLFYLMTQTVQGLVTLIPYFIGIISIFSSSQNIEDNPEDNVIAILTLATLVYVVTILLGIILNTILQMNQGVVFFSLKEESENINTKSVIDQIGTSDPY
ncbi:hypothetical protein GWK08_11630 [Leptobacterium flavescens]|uniref:DUF4013 domain-containing protein n=1 Tax=Leptobacterium flavescens TaxID=472055 RepID=A0A6P0ULJ1_9FLAO|nr:hypothetical protein [Leptobacterium flavescens]NER14094.1 hypothetical protein [Leptobacterium flavescens]